MADTKFHMADTTQDRTGFYIETDECLAHGCCVDIAPRLFVADPESISSLISAQPETEGDLDQLYSAISCCPMDCIKYGGDDSDNLEFLLMLNRPLFPGDPEVRIQGYGKEELWKQIFT